MVKKGKQEEINTNKALVLYLVRWGVLKITKNKCFES